MPHIVLFHCHILFQLVLLSKLLFSIIFFLQYDPIRQVFNVFLQHNILITHCTFNNVQSAVYQLYSICIVRIVSQFLNGNPVRFSNHKYSIRHVYIFYNNIQHSNAVKVKHFVLVLFLVFPPQTKSTTNKVSDTSKASPKVKAF